MSKIIATAAIRGAHRMVERAEEALAKAIEEKGKDAAVVYPNTAYFLPIMYLFLGQKVEKLGDLEESLAEPRKLLAPVPSEELWLPYLGNTLDAGVATLIAEETIESLKLITGPNPVDGIWLGFTDDSILNFRRLITPQPAVEAGRVVLPRAPGLGFTFDAAAIAEHASQPWA